MSKITQPNQESTTADNANWTHIDLREGVACIHLHDSNNRIVRLDRKAELAEDGAPPLQPSCRIKPIAFDPGITAAAAVHDLKVFAADFLPVHPDQRWMVVSWLLTAFFADLSGQRALLRVTGEEGSGKSTAAELLCRLLYGTRWDGRANPQKAVTEGDPLVVVDRPAADASLDGLLLGLAQGRAQSRSLALATGGGDFEADEINLWAYRVDCSSEFHCEIFDSEALFSNLIRRRGRILSGLFQLFAGDVLPGLEFRQTQILEKIRQEFASHYHNHLDPFLALMTVILEALLGTLRESSRQGEVEAWGMVSNWIRGQSRLRQDALVGDKPASFLFFNLAQALRNSDLQVFESMGDVEVEGERIGFSFETCPSEMHSLLTSVGQAKGIKLPFETPRELAAFLEKESSQHEVCLTWSKTKVRRGEPFYEFFKEL